MPTKDYAISAKISIIWKITVHHLKVVKMMNVDDIDEYNRYTMHIIAHFRKIEERIITENIIIDKVKYDQEIRDIIKNLQK